MLALAFVVSLIAVTAGLRQGKCLNKIPLIKVIQFCYVKFRNIDEQIVFLIIKIYLKLQLFKCLT